VTIGRGRGERGGWHLPGIEESVGCSRWREGGGAGYRS
jgi:hypothetical protein